MDADAAHIVNQETGRFYRRHADSFSQTRHAAWKGWERVVEACAPALGGGGPGARTCRVLDLASGNGRFGRFLEERHRERGLEILTVDNCDFPEAGSPSPAGDGRGRIRREHQALDIIDSLLAGNLAARIGVHGHDLAVCFGFFHHVPGAAARYALLDALLESVRPGGFVAVSLWQFMNSADIAAKARASHAAALELLAGRDGLDPAQLEEGDWFLDWQGDRDAFRYCHSFTAGEVDALAASALPRAEEVARFEADGRTGNLNAYLVLKARE